MKSGKWIISVCFFFLCMICMGNRYHYTGSTLPNPAETPTISGPDTACAGTGGYIYTTEPGMTGYTWTISSGGIITSGLGTNSIIVTWNNAGQDSITVTYNAVSDPTVFHVTVFSPVAPGISITASENPICAGTSVTFTAFPVNGGNSPHYQWKVNDINVGSSTAAYTYNPNNGDIIICILTSDFPCLTDNTVPSDPVVMTVNPNLLVSVSITPSANPVCEATPVTFTATAVNGGSSPAYQWFLNGVETGPNSPLFTYLPSTDDIVSCTVQSDELCAINNPAESNPITLTVSPSQPVSISIVSSGNPTCQGNQVTFTATPVNGGNSPVYEWSINGAMQATSSPTYTYAPNDGDLVSCALTSNALCITGNPAVSNVIAMSVMPYAPVSVSIAASSNPVCDDLPVTFTASPANPGSSPNYDWIVNGFEVDVHGPVYTYLPANNNTIVCHLTSSLVCTTGNPAVSNIITMNVIPNLPASINITASANPACQGTSVVFTASVVNGGTAPTLQWKVNGADVGTNSITYSYVPVNGDVVTCHLTSNAACNSGSNSVNSNSITMAVSPPQPVSIAIMASANPFCQGSAVTFTATPVNGGTSPVYNWKVNNMPVGTNSNTYTYSPLDGDVVTCQLVSNASCTTGNPANSNAITMNVSLALPVGITISASANPSCQGQTVTYTATVVNGGSTPGYQWIVNGVPMGSSQTFSYQPSNNDSIICHLNSSNSCATGNPATSNKILMTVYPYLPASVSIVCTANPACQGQTVVFTASPVNGGTTPVYQWKVNGGNAGSNQPTFSYIPVTGDVVTCLLNSSLPCPVINPVTSNAITMVVNPNVPAGITITASANPVCQGTVVTFTAVPVNGGTLPSYQWKINGVNSGTSSTVLVYAPSNGDVITCTLTSNLMCVTVNPITSNSIVMSVSASLEASVTISASANPFCQGLPVTFTSSSLNGGSSPSYQWKVNGASVPLATGSSYTYVPQNGDYVTLYMLSSLDCTTGPANSNPIYMTVNTNTPANLTIAASANPVCQGSTVIFTATPVNGGSGPVYLWKVNGAAAGSNNPIFSYVPGNGDIVTCQVTSNASCVYGSPVTSEPITMNVSTALPAGITISAGNNPYCEGSTVVFSAVPVNGGSNPSYQWKVNGSDAGTNSPSLSYSPLNGDIVQCVLTSNSTCISGANPVFSNQITMVSSTTLPLSTIISASKNPVCQGTSVTYVATCTNGGSTPSYQWMVNSINAGTNNRVFTYVPVNGDVISCLVTSSLSCATPNPGLSNVITMTVNPPQPVSVTISASTNPICVGSVVTFTAVPTNGGTAPSYFWRVNGLHVGIDEPTYTYIPSDGDVITCQLTSNATCISGNPAISNQIVIIVRAEQPVNVTIVASVNPFCSGEDVTFTATPVNGGTAPIYHWKVNGVLTGLNNPVFIYAPQNGDTVMCTLTSNQACICNNPANSNIIVMTASAGLPVSVSIVADKNNVCAGTLVIFTATILNGGSSPLFQWYVNGILKGNNAATFQYAPLNGDVVTCKLTSDYSCATGNPATSNAITMTVIPLRPVSILIDVSQNPTCQGSSVTFNATIVNGGTTPIYRWKNKGVNIPGNNIPTYTYVPVTGDIITCQLTSNETCRTGNPATSNAITMIVDPYMPVSLSISASANPVCQGTQVTYTATPYNGGTAPVYQWNVNGSPMGSNSSTFSYIPLNGDLVSCTIISNAICLSTNTANSNTITMTVSPNSPVAVSISASGNPVCDGATVTYTALPSNGGTTPVYQWKVNGIQTGSNLPVLNYAPENEDTILCVLTSNAACLSGNPATSAPIIMTVGQNFPVSVSIAASSTPPCQGQSITFTATPVNGGPAPAYQWMVNGMNVPCFSPSYSFVPNSGDIIYCQLTSSLACTSGNPALSNPIVMSFSSYLPVSLAITCSANPGCQGSPVTFTANPFNGGTNPVYIWRVNGSIQGANQPTFTYIPSNGDIVTCQLTSSEPCTLNNPVNSNSITMTVFQPVAAGITIAASTNPVCAGTVVTYTATPTNAGSSPAYQWKVRGVNVGSNSSVFSYAPLNGDTVTCTMISSIPCVNNNPVVSNQVIMSVSSDFPVSISISATANPACQGQAITFTAVPTNGGSTPVFRWRVNNMLVGNNQSTYTYTPSNTDVVTCELTSNYTCASGSPAMSNQIVMTVKAYQPVSVSITCSSNPACLGSPVTYTAVGVNGGPSPTYQWKVNGIMVGSNSPTYTYTPANDEIITCRLTSNESCITGNPATSNQIKMIIGSSFPVGVSINISPAGEVCDGTPVTFTAIPVNGGSSPGFQWKVNNGNVGTNSPVYSYTPVNGDIVTCTLLSNLTCGTGNPATATAVTMVVLPIPVSISIAANPVDTICAGTLVTYTATPVNGGSNPTFQWKVNGSIIGPNSTVFTYAPSNGDVVLCKIISNATCSSGNSAVSNTITAHVRPILPVSINITANPAGWICDETSVTYTAAATNPGVAPLYQWKRNGGDVGMNSPSYTCFPNDGDVIYCVLTSDVYCATGNPATSNPIVMTVLPVPVEVSIISNPATPICDGTLVIYTAIPFNGGPGPTYQWKVNGFNAGPDNPVFSFPPQDGDIVKCVLTSNATCASGNMAISNEITAVVDPNLPVSVNIIASPSNVVCTGTSVNFTAVPANEGSAPVYQWRVNGLNVGSGGTTYSYTPMNGDIVTCELASNARCATGTPALSPPVTITVNPYQIVGISIAVSPSTAVCEGSSVTLTATPMNGGSTPAYQWKVNGANMGTNNFQFTYVPVNGDLVTCEMTSNILCPTGNPATSNPLSMAVNPSKPVSVTISAIPDGAVCEGTLVEFSALQVNGGSNPQYIWKVNGTEAGANNPVFIYVPVNGDIITCDLISDATCATGNPASSSPMIMDVIANMPVGITLSAIPAGPVCAGTSVTLDATPVNGGPSPSYQWKVNGLNTGSGDPSLTYIPDNGDYVTCILNSSLPCATGNPAVSDGISLTTIPNSPVSISISADPSGPVCDGTTVSFSALPVNGGSGPVFQWRVNGGSVGTDSPVYEYIPSTGDVVSCELLSNAECPQGNPAVSNDIVMTVNPLLPVSVSVSADPPGTICEGTLVTFTAIPENGGNAPDYQWTVNGSNVGLNDPIFLFAPSNSDKIGCQMISNAICASGNPAISEDIEMMVNPSMPVQVSISSDPAGAICSGTSVTFTALATNGGPVPIFRWYVNNIFTGEASCHYTYTPLNNDVIYCELLSGETCATGNPAVSNQITVTVNPVLMVSLAITSIPTDSVCAGTPVTYHALPVNGGTDPFFQWKVDNVNAGLNDPTFIYTPVNGQIINCELTSDEQCPSGNPAASNGISLKVKPVLPVTVMVSASPDGVICNGTDVTYSAFASNGGQNPTFQWKINGVIVGTNSNSYTFTPADNDVVNCSAASDEMCSSGNPANSDPIVMTVLPNQTVSVSITANPSTTVCQGSTVTFTAASINGGPVPQYRWFVNDTFSGFSGPDFSYAPANNDEVYCELTSGLMCTIENPVVSDKIRLVVNPLLPVSIAISAIPSGAVCSGTSVTFTAVPSNGGLNPHYQWKVNTINAGVNSPVFNYVPVNDDVVSCEMVSDESCPSGNPALSNEITVQVNPILPVSVTVSADPSGPVCEGTTVTFTAIPVNGGMSPAFQWTVNGIIVGPNSNIFSYAPVDGDIISCEVNSDEICTSGNPAVSAGLIMTVNPILPVSVSILENTPAPICAGTFVTFTATALNGGSAPIYLWRVNGSDAGTDSPVFTYIPIDGDIVMCEMSPNTQCPDATLVFSNSIALIVVPTVQVSVSLSSNPSGDVCDGTQVTYSAVQVNGGMNPTYQWYINGADAGVNSDSYMFVPSNGDIIYCKLSSDAICAIGNPANSAEVIIHTNPNLPVSVAVFADPAGNVCEGTEVSYTAVPVNGGSSPSYQWKVDGNNAGSNNITFNYVPANGESISCEVNSDAVCPTGNPASSIPVVMVVDPALPVSVSITATPPGSVCEGTLVTYHAAPVNGGSSPIYHWMVNGLDAGTNSIDFTYSPAHLDVVTCEMTSNASCPGGNPASSNSITNIVNPVLPVGIYISSFPPDTVCAGTLVNVTASVVNGGSNPTYQWKLNGINSGTNDSEFSFIPQNGDWVSCILVSDAVCQTGSPASSDTLLYTVIDNVAASVSISADPSGAVCQGIPVIFQATPVNGGLNPSFQWRVNGLDVGSNNAQFIYVPVNGDEVICILNSSERCVTGNPSTSAVLQESVIPTVPVSVTVSLDPASPFCEGGNVTCTATGINAGTTPVYQWQVNGVNAGFNDPEYSFTPAVGDQVRCILTSDVLCPVNNPDTSVSLQIPVLPKAFTAMEMCIRLTSRDAKPILLRGGVPAGGMYSGPGVAGSLFHPANVPAGMDSALITYTYTAANGCISSKEQYIVVKPSQSFTCGENFIDVRDNQSYPTVQIGTQCWFSKNLDYGLFINSSVNQVDNCIVEKYCYSDNPANCITGGGFYQWDEMMHYNAQAAQQGYCPPGWHVPDENEWNALFDLYNGNAFAGDQLKMGGSSGFNASLAGAFFNSQEWKFIDYADFFWSSTAYGNQKSWAHSVNNDNHGVSRYPSFRSNAFALRCLKD